MATQQDVDNLNDKLTRVEEAVNLVADDTAALKEELRVLNENTSVDLGPSIARVEQMEARLRAIAGPVAGSDPAAPPEPEV